MMVFSRNPNSARRLIRDFLAAAMLWAAGVAGAAEAPPARMTLEQVLERVLATDQTLAIADYEVRKAAVDQMRAWTRVMPSLSVGANANWRGSRTKDEIEEILPAEGTGAVDPLTGQPTRPLTRIVTRSRWTRSRSDSQSFGVNFNQPILDFTLQPARRRTALGRQITEWQLRQQMREVLFAITRQYFEVLKQRGLVAENRKTLGLTTQQVKQAEARLQVQEVIQSDVLRARVDDERARRAVMQAENNLALAKTRLAIMLNYGASTAFDLTEPSHGMLQAGDLPEAVSTAQAHREDIRIAQLSLDRTHAERDEIRARFAPTLDFQVSRDIGTSSSVDRSIDWTAGLSLSWTLIDRGQRVLDLKANRLQIDQDALRISETLRIVSDDVAAAWYAIDTYKRTAASLQVELQAAEAALPVQQEKYAAGLATSLEVQTALRDLASARAQAVTARYELEVAYRELDNVLAVYQNPRIAATMERLLSPVRPSSASPASPAKS